MGIGAVKDKTLLRDIVLKRRIKMPFEEVFRISSHIQNRFLHLKIYRTSKELALYASFKSEVLTDGIMNHAFANDKEVYFPKIVSGQRKLRFIKAEREDDIAPGSYDIPEPGGRHEIKDVHGLDVVVVPGVAFDIYGNRLGYGKGYYDRLLSGLKGCAALIGLAFDFQIVNELPVERHDVSMDMIITEERVIKV